MPLSTAAVHHTMEHDKTTRKHADNTNTKLFRENPRR